MRAIFLYQQDEWGKKAPSQGFFSSDIFVDVQHIVLTAVYGIAVLLMDAVKAVFRKQVVKSCEYAFPRSRASSTSSHVRSPRRSWRAEA